MKKQILNLGKALNRAEQVKINGGISMGCNPYVFPLSARHEQCCLSFGSFVSCEGARCGDDGMCFWL